MELSFAKPSWGFAVESSKYPWPQTNFKGSVIKEANKNPLKFGNQ